MRPVILLSIVILTSSKSLPHSPYPSQTFVLPIHPDNSLCTVHITIVTFKDHLSVDILQRILISNYGQIIPTISSMLNRTLSIKPANNFFEPCAISILVDSLINGSSYVFSGLWTTRYFSDNTYTMASWKHSVIIVLFFSCNPFNEYVSNRLPHRLFYHSLDCGPLHTFPNYAFVSNARRRFYPIEDTVYSIHQRKLPLTITRSNSMKPAYVSDNYSPELVYPACLQSKRIRSLGGTYCTVDDFAEQHYQKYINFSVFGVKAELFWKAMTYGGVISNVATLRGARDITINTHDSVTDKIIYCDSKLDSPKLRPLDMTKPFSLLSWIVLFLSGTACALTSSLTMYGFTRNPKALKTVELARICGGRLAEQFLCLIEKDVPTRNVLNVMLSLVVIYLGNEYKNFLTIDLVFPRTTKAIQNLTGLLDLGYTLHLHSNLTPSRANNSIFYHTAGIEYEINTEKRANYVQNARDWLKFSTFSTETWIKRVMNVDQKKNAICIRSLHSYQKIILKVIKILSYPSSSCNFVTRSFSSRLQTIYAYNPKA
jgi:hypothetical protein